MSETSDPAPEPSTALRVAEYFAEVAERGDGPVLDVGCGSGVVGAEVASRGRWAIDGLDISAEMLALAQEKLNGAGASLYGSLIRADLSTPLDIAANTYGSAVSAGVFTGHLGPAAINELVRIVRPGGLIVLGIKSGVFAAQGFPDYLDGLVGLDLVEVLGERQSEAAATSRLIALRVH